ncbi:MAG: GDSL-type esterase/lipase family protein [Pirellulaceae bacterium]
MNPLIYTFGSGLAFFVGVAVVLISVLLFRLGASRLAASLVSILALLGLAISGLSAAPLSYWYYGVAGLVTLAWLASERRRSRDAAPKPEQAHALRYAVVAIWLGGAALELPHHFAPRLAPLGNPPLYIIGDSLTAGAGMNERQTWPDLLPPGIQVQSFAQPGANAASAMHQAGQIPAGASLVLVEIGGNDLLGDTSAAEFERDLKALLTDIARPHRTVVMFELPLPPTYNEFGRIQRRLAARHGVRLIPKRVLMGVLAQGDTTLDSIHLSPGGHRRMAAAVWRVIEPVYKLR